MGQYGFINGPLCVLELMQPRYSLLPVLALVLAVAVANGQDGPPSKLPIDVPKAASVNFEAQGSGREILTTVKHMLSGDMFDPTAAVDKITIKTGAGNLDLKLDDLKPLLDKIHALHVVSYEALPNEDPFKHFEKRFVDLGLKRVILVPGADGLLIMRQIEATDQYAIVLRQKGNVLVLRSDGAPGLGDFGRVLFESLSRAVLQAVNTKKQK